MGRVALEVADIFRARGPAWRQAQHGHLSLGQLKVMSAIEQCRSAALGGHVLRCDACEQVQIAYNSCRNRHCPKCQARAARRWLEARQADLLPVEYYHLVFTLPAPISAIAYYNKAVIYDLLFAVAAETLRTIAADPKHLGAQVGVTLVLHTWGSALTHHPHVHGIVPGGGLSADGERWVRVPAGILPAGARALAAVSSALPRRIRRRAYAGRAAVLRERRGPERSACIRPMARAAAHQSNGSSTPSARSPGPRRCSAICRATPIGWRSRTVAYWPSMSAASPSAGRTTAARGRRATRP